MKPVTIRYFGLIPIRKRTYLILQSITLVLCGAWVIAALALNNTPLGAWKTPLGTGNILLLLGVIVTVAEILDLTFTLRAFRRREEEEKQRCDGAQFPAPRHADTNSRENDERFRQRM